MKSFLPNKLAIRVYALSWALGYLLVYFAFRGLFPDKALSDALYIQDVTDSVAGNAPSQGFAIMAAIFGAIPFSFGIVGGINAFILFKLASCVRTLRGMVLLPFLLFPLIITDMPAPVKETLVLVMASLFWWWAARARSERRFFFVILVVYIFYGALVRDYFLLIAGVFFGLYLLMKTPLLLRGLFVLPPLAGLILAPASTLTKLGGARDVVNDFYAYGNKAPLVRTYFINPFPCDNAIHFLGNYFYAFLILNIPFVRDFGPKECLLFVNVVLCFWMIFVGLRTFQGVTKLLPTLFLSHLFVLWLFEPDSGSYMRHFLSVLPYLMPTFLWLEERRATRFREVIRQGAALSPGDTNEDEGDI